jgi:hypothetical protein
MSDENPFRMKELSPEGPFVLGDELCSERRKDFLLRGNNILASYANIATFSNLGLQQVKALKITTDTPMRLTIGGRVIQCKHRTLIDMYPAALKQLANQTFTVIYGNFEAYIVDVLVDAFEIMKVENPQQDALKLLAMKGWEGKIDSIGQKIGVSVGKRQFQEKFKSIPMEFAGQSCSDSISFLQNIADLRHLIVHSAGRVDERLARSHPEANLKKGEDLAVPVELPFDLHLFLNAFTDVFDKAFADKFNWERNLIQPEYLVRK